MRKPCAIGFYPGHKEDLQKAIKEMIAAAQKEPVKQISNPRGIIVPHAGYQFSGKIAVKTYLAGKTDRKNFMIFCPNHTGYGTGIAVSTCNWMTPLGEVKNSQKIGEKLISSGKFENDEIAHRHEHSAEIQLPILQTVYKNVRRTRKSSSTSNMPLACSDFSIIPVCLQHEEFSELEKIANIITDLDEVKQDKVYFIASSDLIHFGPMYGYVPIDDSVENQLKWVEETDQRLMDMICKLDAKKFYHEITENDYTVCGYIPITLLLLVLKKIGTKQGHIIDSSTSYKTQKSNSFVGYGGIVFE